VQEAATNKLTDMSPIARLVVEPALVVVRADSQIKTLKEFIDAAKAKPGALKMSGGSITSRENTVRQLLMQLTGARWAFISFPSGGERIAALLGGHVDMMIVDPSEAGEQVRAGKLRVIAQVNERRLPHFPDTPTIKEAGYDIPNVPQMRGVVGAPGMSAETVAFYEDLFLKTSKTAGWQKFIDDSQLDGEFVKAADLRPFFTKFEGELREILKAAGAKVVREARTLFLRLGHGLHRCRPRESGDPYAVPVQYDDTAEIDLKRRWLWVPACAGTTLNVLVCRAVTPPRASAPTRPQPCRRSPPA
jgi:putative tricarboxylic transport membrane protein